MKRRLLHAAVLLVAASAAIAGQEGARPKFSTVTIRRNVSGISTGGGGYVVNGRFEMTNVHAAQLIRIAYSDGAALAPSQVLGGPEWIDQDGYDITATAGPEFQGERTGQMMGVRHLLLQSLLEERFTLAVHRETRELPRYALRLASEGQLGPQLTRPSAECAALVSDACAVRVTPGRFSMGRAPLAALVGYLSREVLRTVVVDRTDLDGLFALTLEWSADDASAGPAPVLAALREQLGFKLDLERAQTDVVVIDHVERPTLD